MKAELLAREFAPRRVGDVHGHLLLRAVDALALVDRASEEGVPIVRVDGFLAGAAADASAREHLADFSASVAEGHGCWGDAETLIRARGSDGLVFELTLGDDPIEVV